MTTLACPDRFLTTDIDGRQWGIYHVGNIYMHWLEDSSGNPLIRSSKDNQLHYANWNPKTHKWDCKELFSIASRKAFLKQKYHPPTRTEQALTVSRQALRPKMDIKGIRKHPSDKQDKPEKALASPIKLNALVPATDRSSGTSLESGSIKRPLLLIYVRFSDSTGTDMPDSDILRLIADKETFGTVANYYQQNFKGAVEFSVFNDKVYHVTLSRSAYPYCADISPTNQIDSYKFAAEVVYEAVKDVVENQGVDILSLADEAVEDPDFHVQWGYPTVHPELGLPIIFHNEDLKVIDPALLTPVILLHGQEAAVAGGSNQSGAQATEASVWGHAMTGNCLVGFDSEDNLFCGWDSSSFENMDSPQPHIYDFYLNEENTEIHAYPKFKLRIGSSAAFGVFHGANYFSIGIMAHELGHALFYLPDLYDVQTPSPGDSSPADDDIAGMGVWSLMANNWTNIAGQQSGSCPPNLDGYCLHYFNQRFCQPVFSNGSQTITDPFTPHVIIDPDNPDETFILQLRCFTGYDQGIPAHWKVYNSQLASGYSDVSTQTQTYDPQADQAKPGVLIEHVNSKLRLNKGNRQSGIKNTGASADLPYSVLLGGVLEAHGGSQHLRVDVRRNSSRQVLPECYGKYNDGDRKDLYGVFDHNEFGQTTDPDTSYWMSKGKAQFDISNISVDASSCTATYDIVFAQEAEDPNWDDLPSDPLRPKATITPEEPEEPTPPPIETACARPRFWRFRDLRHVVPVGFIQHW